MVRPGPRYRHRWGRYQGGPNTATRCMLVIIFFGFGLILMGIIATATSSAFENFDGKGGNPPRTIGIVFLSVGGGVVVIGLIVFCLNKAGVVTTPQPSYPAPITAGTAYQPVNYPIGQQPPGQYISNQLPPPGRYSPQPPGRSSPQPPGMYNPQQPTGYNPQQPTAYNPQPPAAYNPQPPAAYIPPPTNPPPTNPSAPQPLGPAYQPQPAFSPYYVNPQGQDLPYPQQPYAQNEPNPSGAPLEYAAPPPAYDSLKK